MLRSLVAALMLFSGLVMMTATPASAITCWCAAKTCHQTVYYNGNAQCTKTTLAAGYYSSSAGSCNERLACYCSEIFHPAWSDFGC
jgi:hypothetical protein